MSLVANSRYKLTHEPPPFRRAGQRTAQSTTNAPPAPVWAAANAQIVHPSRGRIAFEPYWYQHDFLASYHEPRRIILKARQIGFSQVFVGFFVKNEFGIPKDGLLNVFKMSFP